MPSDGPSPPSGTGASLGRIAAEPAPRKPLWRLTTAEEHAARFDGPRESNLRPLPGFLPCKLFILSTSQIENFGLTEYRAKVLVNGQKCSGQLKSAEGHENNNEEGCFYAITEARGIRGI